METLSPTTEDEDAAVIAAYALGEADPATVARAEALLASDQRFRSMLDSYRTVAETLPLAAPAATPAPDLRARLLARVEAEASGKPAPKPQRPQTARRGWSWRWVALACNFALILGLAGWNISLQQQQQTEAARFQRTWNTMVSAMSAPGVRQYQLAGNSGTSAAFLFAPEQRLGCLVASNLPALPADQVYQVWLEQNGQVRAVGTFRPNASGNGWLVIENTVPIDDFSSVRVTVAPAGGSSAPEGKPVISGSIA